MATDPIQIGILREIASRPFELDPEHEYRVTGGGHEALFVGFIAERWLQNAPHGPLLLHYPQAVRAVRALAEGWTATVVHALARGPQTFDELHEAVVGDLSSNEVRRHLAALQRTKQVDAMKGADGEEIYAATEWLQAGIVPLMAAARLERREPQEGMAPIDALDVDAGFRCSLSMIQLPKQLSGTCSLGVRLTETEDSNLIGVHLRVDQGHIVACESGLDLKADAWAAGTASEWLDTIIEPDVHLVNTGGDDWLTQALLRALHETLFGVPVAPE